MRQFINIEAPKFPNQVMGINIEAPKFPNQEMGVRTTQNGLGDTN